MSGYLLDTNVISELSRERPHPSVVDFLAEWDDLWLSVIVIEELEMGVQLLPEGRRRERLRDWLSRLLTDFDWRILPIERREAEWAAAFQARAHRGGGMLQLADALIAGNGKDQQPRSRHAQRQGFRQPGHRHRQPLAISMILVTEANVETPPSIGWSISAGRRRTGRTSGRTSPGAGGRGVHWTRA